MRANHLRRFILVFVVVVAGTTAGAQQGEAPCVDPADEPISITDFVMPGPTAPPPEAPSVPTPLLEQVDPLKDAPVAADTGALDPLNALDGGAIASGRSGGRGTSSMQHARRSLKQLMRQLG